MDIHFDSRTRGAILMVAGTSVGAGMIALPVQTQAAGLPLTFIAFALVWALMFISARSLLSVSLAFKAETNLITLTRANFGAQAAHLVWLIYLGFLYALMAAYTSGGGNILHSVLTSLSVPLPPTAACALFAIISALLIQMGPIFVDKLNRVLMFILLASYSVLIWRLSQLPAHVSPHQGSWLALRPALPLMVTSFGYHLLIPSLRDYLNSRVDALKRALLWGSLLPLLIYGVWVSNIVKYLPEVLSDSPVNPAERIYNALDALSPVYGRLVSTFSFAALSTSLLGVAMGLSDFLKDAFKLTHSRRHQMLLSLMTFAPGFCFAALSPQGFIHALKYAGLFAAFLLVILPNALILKQSTQQALVVKSLQWLALVLGLLVAVSSVGH